MSDVGKMVIVTDKSRGIAYGRLVEVDLILQVAVLAEARHVYSFESHKDAPGLWGLADLGPQSGSRITNPIERQTIVDISKVGICSPTAVKAFEKIKWRK